MFYNAVLHLLEQNGTTMNMEAWVALAAIFVTLGGGLITVWVKLKSDVEVMKSEIATLRDMVNKRIEVDGITNKTLSDLNVLIAKIEGKLDSKQDK